MESEKTETANTPHCEYKHAIANHMGILLEVGFHLFGLVFSDSVLCLGYVWIMHGLCLDCVCIFLDAFNLGSTGPETVAGPQMCKGGPEPIWRLSVSAFCARLSFCDLGKTRQRLILGSMTFWLANHLPKACCPVPYGDIAGWFSFVRACFLRLRKWSPVARKSGAKLPPGGLWRLGGSV